MTQELLFAARPVPAVLGSLLLPSSVPTCSPSQTPDPGSPRGPSGLFPRWHKESSRKVKLLEEGEDLSGCLSAGTGLGVPWGSSKEQTET